MHFGVQDIYFRRSTGQLSCPVPPVGWTLPRIDVRLQHDTDQVLGVLQKEVQRSHLHTLHASED